MRALSAVTWKVAGFGAFAVAAVLVIYALVGTPRGMGFVWLGRYTDYLRRRLRSLHVFRPVAPIVVGQVSALLAIATLATFGRLPYGYVLAVLVVAAPAIVIEHRVKRRVAELDASASPFSLTLANALKATPSIGNALDHVASLMDGPVTEELQLALKETRLGRSLDEALAAIVVRSRSPKLGTVIISLLIGRQVGGNLGKTLETTAATLRELERLEGVLRQRTAEGRMQLWAMVIAPFALSFGAYEMDKTFFEPLMTTGWLGHGVVLVSMLTYAGSLVAARRILQVDL